MSPAGRRGPSKSLLRGRAAAVGALAGLVLGPVVMARAMSSAPGDVASGRSVNQVIPVSITPTWPTGSTVARAPAAPTTPAPTTPAPTTPAPTTPAPTPAPTTPGSPGTGPPESPTVGGMGAVAGASVSPLFDRLRLAASFVVAARLQPGGGTGAEEWRAPADLRTPTVIPARPAPRPGPAGPSTLEDVLWAAYASAAARARDGCHLPVTLLAAIGEVESSSLRGRSLDARHDVVPPVLGPRLTGGGLAAIRDSDGGRLDGDPAWDRAVGPMQFIPGTWRLWGADGNGDGVANPQNVEDATLAAARYLCAGGRDLDRAADLREAVLSYNHSRTYLDTVLGLVDAMTSGLDAGP